jgi:hypothetical protein
MPVKFEDVKAGDLLWCVRRQHGQRVYWPVKVLEIDYGNGHASCSWNWNKPTYYSKGQVERLQRRKPRVKK